ncbi:hypothetical protein M6D93_11595 [Jatrophihabitans telluris]|uniref:EPTP domain-containing protein n=1 Tax=Jatrophihabitans telluris TaxID=2038343 RepID=A0ABY4QVE3_9ACTN|nr:hypothetical protein [Jatrophihabitans telluris]UQX86949.1 hypothetical protein M6D93_11595 [Jatrophihabitans telluris]
MALTLTELQRIPTSGARAVMPFCVGGLQLLAIPQFATDVPHGKPGMHGGDSATNLLLLQRVDDRFVPWSELPAPGGEDAEFFTIGDQAFLAVASIRTGAGPYTFATESHIYRWSGEGFELFQTVPAFAARQWKYWTVAGRHFLGLAQGVPAPGLEAHNLDSVVYEWDGASFVEHQRIPSRWAYNWHAFRVEDGFFVAHADHLSDSMLYRWDGTRLQPYQSVAASGGRAFATFVDGGATHLVVACITGTSTVLRWTGREFITVQVLAGEGARELAVLRQGNDILVVRINFILGNPSDPQPELDSVIYRWDGSRLRPVLTFPTSGGTDVACLVGRHRTELIVSNSLDRDLRFSSSTVRYALTRTDV